MDGQDLIVWLGLLRGSLVNMKGFLCIGLYA